jgi:hypothetical protein
MDQIFEKATRMKLRFNHRGVCFVEDLWDISLKNLDKMYIELASEIKTNNIDSLLGTKKEIDEETELKIEIIKHIVAIKLAEKEARDIEQKRKEQKQKIMSLIVEKQDEALKGKSVEELTALLNSLD